MFAKPQNLLLALVLSLSTLLLSLGFFYVQSAHALDNSSWTEDDFVIANEGNEKIIKTWSEQGLKKLNAGNTDLLIPDGITAIGANPVPGENGLVHQEGQNQLKSLTLPPSVRTINYGAFHGHAIKTIKFSEGLEKIDSGAFVGNQLEQLILPKSLKYIGWTAFQDNQITSLAFKGDMNDLTINDPLASGNPAFDNQTVKNIRIKKGESIRPINISLNNDSLRFQTVYAPSAESTHSEPTSEFVETDRTGLITAKKAGKTFAQHAVIWNAKNIQGDILDGTHYISSKYEIEVYDSANVNFDPNGGIMAEKDRSQEVELGKQAVKPANNPKREGYSFEGWTLDDKAFEFSTPIEKDITLTAQWKEKKPTSDTNDNKPNNGSITDTKDKPREVKLDKQTSTTDTVKPSDNSTTAKKENLCETSSEKQGVKSSALPKTDDANSVTSVLALFASTSFATAFALRKLHTIK